MSCHANIAVLGEARHRSPLRRCVDDQGRIPGKIVRSPGRAPEDEILFELAGARAKLFFDPRRTRAGIVTCGGLCPGLNDVVRSLFFELHHAYGVKEVLGFRWGYQGLDPKRGEGPVVLKPALVDGIHQQGGTILGTPAFSAAARAFWCCIHFWPGRAISLVLMKSILSTPAKAGPNEAGSSKSAERTSTPRSARSFNFSGLRVAATKEPAWVPAKSSNTRRPKRPEAPVTSKFRFWVAVIVFDFRGKKT